MGSRLNRGFNAVGAVWCGAATLVEGAVAVNAAQAGNREMAGLIAVGAAVTAFAGCFISTSKPS